MGLQAVRLRLLAAAVAICCMTAPALSYWQSRDQITVGAPASYSGPGDVQAFSVWWGLRAYTLATAGTKSANICNSGDANCADINTLANGNFDVATATGAPLNCGGAGGTCTVKTLYDKTGNLLCTGSVACDITNSTIATRPTLVLNCLGTLPCLGLSSTQTLITTTSLVSSMTQIYSVYGVGNRTGGTTSFSDITSNSGATNVQMGFGTSANTAAMYAGNVATKTSVADNSFHNIISIFNGVSSTLYADGSSSTVDAGTGATGTGKFCITGIGCTGNGLTGQVVEAGWKNSDITSVLSALNSNVHSYWGF